MQKDSSYDSGMPIEKHNHPFSSSADGAWAADLAPARKSQALPELGPCPPIRVLAAGPNWAKHFTEWSFSPPPFFPF